MRASAYLSWAFLLSPIWAAPAANPCDIRSTDTSFTDYAYVYVSQPFLPYFCALEKAKFKN